MSVELSIVLPTDNFETIRAVLQHVDRQTIADRLETIVVIPDGAEIPDASALVRRKIVRVRSTSSLAAARAAGVSAATAPFIFMGETHSYLHHDAAEKLLAAARAGGWSVVVPAFENANPHGVLSWASFLVDYGKWTSASPAGEIQNTPLFNALFRHVDLPQTSAQLERVFAHGDEISLVLRARHARVYFEPAARISHLNLNTTCSAHEQFVGGILTGRQRAQRWRFVRRILYLVASPLIPFVLFRRNFPGAWRTIRARRLSWRVMPVMFFLNFAKAAGELFGYAGLTSARHEAAMDRYEIRKRDYVR